jgi:hypothetical protein
MVVCPIGYRREPTRHTVSVCFLQPSVTGKNSKKRQNQVENLGP